MTAPERPAMRGLWTFTMAGRRHLHAPGSGIMEVVGGFGTVLIVGTILLMLPFATTTGDRTSFTDALFTAVSAMCVTGLVLVDTPEHWSTGGHLVIIALVQLGGLGYMLGTTVILWTFGRRLGLHDQHMMRVYYGAPSMRETLSFARGVATFTFVFEVVGAVLLFAGYWLSGESVGTSAWWGVFHSVSAFNNAGFTISSSDLVPYTGNLLIMLTIMGLVLCGAIGYVPLMALKQRRSFRRVPLDSKLIFATSGILLFAGGLFFTVVEWNNPETLGQVRVVERPLIGLFHTASRTSGFGVTDVGAMEDSSTVATIGLMFVGGAAGSTAGGLKVGAFALLFATMIAALRGREEVTAFRRVIPTAVIQQATTLALFYVGMVFVVSLALTITSHLAFEDVIFEAVSALGTVGFSAAGTVTHGEASHTILVIAMLIGRFAPLFLVLYMTKPRKRPPFHYPPDSVRLG